jgi:hypothetical protein
METVFNHPSTELRRNKKLVYSAMSKHLAYFKDHISKFILEKGAVPLNPFAIPYFRLETLPRDMVREANNNYLKRADEVWVFGKISDGVLAEILLAKEENKPITYFKIVDSKEIKQINKNGVEFEEGLEKFKDKL